MRYYDISRSVKVTNPTPSGLGPWSVLDVKGNSLVMLN